MPNQHERADCGAERCAGSKQEESEPPARSACLEAGLVGTGTGSDCDS